MSAKSQVRDHFRKEILNFTKGQDLKKRWVINRSVEYNGVKYENKEGLETKDTSGMWRMGWTIRPSETGYVMIHWTIVGGKVTWNGEITFNKKMTPMCGYVNLFMGSPKFYSDGNSVSNDYLLPLINEGSGSINTEKGFEFISNRN
tara:strand:- start:41 stop:478 length:438 start_codon:yes stop_codon:yes gene_type:complete